MSETTSPPALFVLARLTEDEAAASAARHVRLRGGDGVYTGLVPVGSVDTYVGWTSDDQRGHHIEGTALMQRHDPARVLAECAALRAIVDLHRVAQDLGPREYNDGMAAGLLDAVLVLTQIWANHPDHNPRWEVGG